MSLAGIKLAIKESENRLAQLDSVAILLLEVHELAKESHNEAEKENSALLPDYYKSVERARNKLNCIDEQIRGEVATMGALRQRELDLILEESSLSQPSQSLLREIDLTGIMLSFAFISTSTTKFYILCL
jgi:hypothetical protein